MNEENTPNFNLVKEEPKSPNMPKLSPFQISPLKSENTLVDSETPISIERDSPKRHKAKKYSLFQRRSKRQIFNQEFFQDNLDMDITPRINPNPNTARPGLGGGKSMSTLGLPNFQNLLTINNSNTQTNTNITNNNTNILEYEEVPFSETVLISKDFISQDFFCDAFFISGLPMTRAKVIPDSEHFIPPCKHQRCGILPAYKPEVLNKFPEQDLRNFEITQPTASLCFPFGIKLCYSQDEEQIKPLKPYMNIITHDKGEHYMYIYYYYQKYDYFQFKKIFDFDPVKDQFHFNKLIQLIEKACPEKASKSQNASKNDHSREESKFSQLELKIQDNLDVCSEFINSDYIYLPYAACLISKYPYSKEMETSLNVILHSAFKSNSPVEEINKLLINLIYEILVPPLNSKLLFFLPYCPTSVEIKSSIYQDIPIFICSTHIDILLDYFSPENILYIYHMMVLGQQILFIDNDQSVLAKVSQAFMAILYPFKWVCAYIPVLGEDTVKFLQAMMPFIMGIEYNLLNTAKSYITEDNIFIVYIDQNHIEPSSYFRLNKKFNQKNLSKYINQMLPELPVECKNEILDQVKSIKKDHDTEKFVTNFENNQHILNMSTEKPKKSKFTQLFSKNSNSKLDIRKKDHCDLKKKENTTKLIKKLRKVFLKSMVMMIGDYQKYVSYIEELPLFNNESFIDSRPEKYHNFYSELIHSQNFRYFLQTKDQLAYFHKMCSRFNNFILTKGNVSIKNLKKSKNIFSSLLTRSSSVHGRNSKLNQDRSESNQRSPHINMSNNNITESLFTRRESLSKTPNLTISKIDYSTPMGDSQSKSDMEGNKSSENVKDLFLITPYFIKHPTIRSDISKIEEYISEKYKDTLIQESGKDYIFYPNFLMFDYSLIPPNLSVKKYIFPCEKFVSKSDTNIDKNYMTISQVQPFDFGSRKNSLALIQEKEKELQINREQLSDCMKMILTSEPLNLQMKNNIQNHLHNKKVRMHFAKILFQDKFMESKWQILTEKCFGDLYFMIFSALLQSESESSQYEVIRLITKSTFHYYK
jgi:hypothetical protein